MGNSARFSVCSVLTSLSRGTPSPSARFWMTSHAPLILSLRVGTEGEISFKLMWIWKKNKRSEHSLHSLVSPQGKEKKTLSHTLFPGWMWDVQVYSCPMWRRDYRADHCFLLAPARTQSAGVGGLINKSTPDAESVRLLSLDSKGGEGSCSIPPVGKAPCIWLDKVPWWMPSVFGHVQWQVNTVLQTLCHGKTLPFLTWR